LILIGAGSEFELRAIVNISLQAQLNTAAVIGSRYSHQGLSYSSWPSKNINFIKNPKAVFAW